MSESRFRTRGPGKRRVVVAATAVVALVGVALPASAWYSSAAAKPASAPWLDSSKPVAARVDSLLHAMTLAEKVGQMDQQLVTTLTDPSSATCGDNGFNLPNPTACRRS